MSDSGSKGTKNCFGFLVASTQQSVDDKRIRLQLGHFKMQKLLFIVIKHAFSLFPVETGA